MQKITLDEITIMQESSPSKKTDYWDWKIWLIASEDILNKIKVVRYGLHPTFPNPIRIIDDPSDGFSLKSSGWGEFNVKIEIIFNEGNNLKTTHWLTLKDSNNRIKGDFENFNSSSLAEWASATNPEDRESLGAPNHTVFVSAALSHLDTVDQVTKNLKQHDIAVVTSQNIEIGESLESFHSNTLENVDMAVIMLSDRLGPSSRREIESARTTKPTVLVSHAETAAEFNNTESDFPLKVIDPDDPDKITFSIVEMLENNASVEE